VFTPKLEQLLGPARRNDEELTAKHEAVAASLQAVFEKAAMHVLRHVHKASGNPRLCLAGGCAMNSVANGKIREQTPFREVFIQPAAGDNGTALGAAFHAWHSVSNAPREFVMEHAYWGPQFSDEDVAAMLRAHAAQIRAAGCTQRCWHDEPALDAWTASQIANGRVVGWFQGRMEWGSRALGNRSILAGPRRADMRDIINARIKFRERFRPFAPSVTEEALDEYFAGAVPDPFHLHGWQRPSVFCQFRHEDGASRRHEFSFDAGRVHRYSLQQFRCRRRRHGKRAVGRIDPAAA